MVRVKDVFAYLDKIAPVTMAMDFDNVGLLVGKGEAEVTRVLVALDITDAVIDEAIERGAQVIVAHHPMIRDSLKCVTDADLTGRKVLKLAQHGIAAICMHTNLDAAAGGINDVLAEIFGLRDAEILWKLGELNGAPYGLGRVGTLFAPVTMTDFLPRVKALVQTAGVRYYDAGRPVSRVAVLGGSGSDAIQMAVDAGCDTYVLGEAKYHGFLEAQELGLNLVEADHYCTEHVICEPLRERLCAQFPGLDVAVSARHGQVIGFC